MSACTHPASAQYVDRARGTVTCTLCGDIVQDQQLELDPAFARGEKTGSRGLRSLGNLRPTRGVIGTRPLSSRPSVEAARRGMVSIARQLDISDDMTEMAVAIYKLAVGMNAVSGARTAILCACLYAVCRRERTSHMIYDFAEAARVSHFEILSYMRLICQATNTEVPVVDPSCTILRFAEHMNLGALTGPIVVCALKVLRAMQEDWIACGRRPMGVCVAALLVGCYMFSIPRSADEVCGLVRLTADTITRRIGEFAATPTAELMNIDEYTPNDRSLPPSFTESSLRPTDIDLGADMRELSSLYYELVAEAKVSSPATLERCLKWRRFIERHGEMQSIEVSPDKLDLAKLTPKMQLEILGLPNTVPIDPETVRDSVKREEQKILLKSELTDSECASQFGGPVPPLHSPFAMGPPTQLGSEVGDDATQRRRMTDYYHTLMTEDPHIMSLRRDFDFDTHETSKKEASSHIAATMNDDDNSNMVKPTPSPAPVADHRSTSLAPSELIAPVTRLLYDSERRLALPWEFIVLQETALEDSTDIDHYLVLDNEERVRRQKVGEALYKDDWDRGRARTKEEIERLEESRLVRKRVREPIREHATVQDALARALRSRGAGAVNISQIDELIPGLVSQPEGGLEEDWLNE